MTFISVSRELLQSYLHAFGEEELAPRVSTLNDWDMRDICAKLGVNDKVTPHDLRRTLCSRVTALGFGREAMNRVTNHREGGIADVYDRHKYAKENREIMEAVARHLITIAEADAANVVTFGR